MFDKIEIILIRHGESEGNVDSAKHSQVHDAVIQLTDKGRAQATETGVFMDKFIQKNNWKNYRMFSSSYDRAIQTMELIKDQITDQRQINAVKHDDRIKECEYGDVDGLTETQMKEQFPQFYKLHMRDIKSKAKYFSRYPRGESPADVGIRCRSFFDAMTRDYKEHGIDKFIIVCHGITLRAFMKELLHAGNYRWYATQKNPKNASVYHIKAKQAAEGLKIKENEGCIFIPKLSK